MALSEKIPAALSKIETLDFLDESVKGSLKAQLLSSDLDRDDVLRMRTTVQGARLVTEDAGARSALLNVLLGVQMELPDNRQPPLEGDVKPEVPMPESDVAESVPLAAENDDYFGIQRENVETPVSQTRNTGTSSRDRHIESIIEVAVFFAISENEGLRNQIPVGVCRDIAESAADEIHNAYIVTPKT